MTEKSESFDKIMQEMEHVVIEGKKYISVVDLIKCVNHIEENIIQGEKTITTNSILRWLRHNLINMLE